jgi:hypothetical protein
MQARRPLSSSSYRANSSSLAIVQPLFGSALSDGQRLSERGNLFDDFEKVFDIIGRTLKTDERTYVIGIDLNKAAAAPWPAARRGRPFKSRGCWPPETARPGFLFRSTLARST